MTTPEASGKVQRLRNDPRVELRPCGRMGRVGDGVEPVAGVAEVLTDAGSRDRMAEGTCIVQPPFAAASLASFGRTRLASTDVTREARSKLGPATS